MEMHSHASTSKPRVGEGGWAGVGRQRGARAWGVCPPHCPGRASAVAAGVLTLVQTEQGLRFWSHGALNVSDDSLPTTDSREPLSLASGPVGAPGGNQPELGAGLWSS